MITPARPVDPSTAITKIDNDSTPPTGAEFVVQGIRVIIRNPQAPTALHHAALKLLETAPNPTISPKI